MVQYFNNGFVKDPWVYVEDDAPIAELGNVIVSLARWRAGGADVVGVSGDVGVFVGPVDEFDARTDRLSELALVSIVFEKFGDGRGYSQARSLRDQYDFAGEIRARGDILSDQLPLMLRCGFSAFEVSHEPTIAALKAGELPGILRTYQGPEGKRFGAVRRPIGQAGPAQANGGLKA